MSDRLDKAVRAATPADEDTLFALLKSLQEVNNSFGFNVSDTRVKEHIAMGTRGTGGLHGVIDGDGELAGSVGMVWDRWWFSEEWGLAQIWLFVRPAYRRSHYADNLVEWSKRMRSELEQGAGLKVRMANAVISEERLEEKLRFWRRHSSQMIGAIFEIK